MFSVVSQDVLVFQHNKWKKPSCVKHASLIKQVVCNETDIHAIDYSGKIISSSTAIEELFMNKKIQSIYPKTKRLLVITNDGLYSAEMSSAVLTEIYRGAVLKLHCGISHDFILTKKGYKCKGDNSYGQFGMRGIDKSDTFIYATEINKLDVAEISVGGWHNYARLNNGTFYGWGLNSEGRLGNNTFENVYNPVLLEHHKLGMIDIVACSWHSVGLTRRGQVYTWGLDQSKTLGIPNIKETHVNEPTLVLDAGIERIFGGHYAMGCYAVSRDGTVYVWGRDNQQRFGVANQPQAPTKVEGLSGLPILDICVLLDYSVVHIGYKPSGQRVKRVNKFADVIIAAKL